ncbi:MAG TPA: LOG family protein [Candidatus Acidoferrales bacterium]|nr:LOG family protein [Candidatus Acidoferrales bacterium]
MTVADVEEEALAWIRKARLSGNEDLVAEMLETVLKLAADGTSRGDLKILNRTLKELRHAFKVFAPFRNTRKTSIFGSGRISENDPYYRMASEFAAKLAAEGFMVITGAGEGIMRAGNHGAGREKSFGVNIRLPLHQKPNRFIRGDAKLLNFHFFFTRKLIFVKETDAVAFFPGGFGTHDEAIEILTLMQTGKSQLIPMVLLDLPAQDYWQQWHRFVRTQMLARGYIDEDDLSLFKILDDTDAALREICAFYRNFHSYRFVNQDLVIRVVNPPSAALLQRLNETFRDILYGGAVTEIGPLPEEFNEPETLSFHRLLVPFNRRNYGRLRQMIDAINAES